MPRSRRVPGLALAQIARGFLMGSADVVPGVSGGTVALVLGIYEELVATIRTGAGAGARLLRGDLQGFRREIKRVDWAFLLPLLAGIALAIVTLAGIIERLLDERPVQIAAVFFGLVAASIVIAWDLLRRRDGVRLAALAISAIVTFFLLGLRGPAAEDPTLAFVFAAGAIAIIAMILPGISGSFLLLMIGMYDFILSAVNARDAVTIAVFAAGAAIGLGLFSSALDWLLRRHHDTVLAALVGLMAGSLRVLWPWPDGTAGTRIAWPEANDILIPALLAAGAGALLLLVVRVAGRPAQHR